MSDDKVSDGHPPSWEGHRLQAEDGVSLKEAIRHACDYRGDVTIHLKTGEQVIGFVFDRQEEALHPYMKIFREGQSAPFMVQYQDVAAVEFSGEDTAFGRSWEDWAKKWQKPPVN